MKGPVALPLWLDEAKKSIFATVTAELPADPPVMEPVQWPVGALEGPKVAPTERPCHVALKVKEGLPAVPVDVPFAGQAQSRLAPAAKSGSICNPLPVGEPLELPTAKVASVIGKAVVLVKWSSAPC
jgi:hypothetical protein